LRLIEPAESNWHDPIIYQPYNSCMFPFSEWLFPAALVSFIHSTETRKEISSITWLESLSLFFSLFLERWLLSFLLTSDISIYNDILTIRCFFYTINYSKLITFSSYKCYKNVNLNKTSKRPIVTNIID